MSQIKKIFLRKGENNFFEDIYATLTSAQSYLYMFCDYECHK